METNNDKVKLFYNVYYIFNLTHNLFSVGQLMMNNYIILFDNRASIITDKYSFD